MNINAEIIADSISTMGIRLTTFEVYLPKCLSAEFNTHRMLSKNFQSSRAIPVGKNNEIESMVPRLWLSNQPGMVASGAEITNPTEALNVWNTHVSNSKSAATSLSELGLHKQWANRLNDWHIMTKGVVTATEWNNFFYLRDHPDAQPEIRELAQKMKAAIESSTPTTLQPGEWHLPYVTVRGGRYFSGEEEIDLETAKQISASCCAQTSYRRNDDSVEKARTVFKKLNVGPVEERTGPPHSSPLEHQGTPIGRLTGQTLNGFPDGVTHLTRDGAFWSGNFKGWVQHRQIVPNTAVW